MWSLSQLYAIRLETKKQSSAIWLDAKQQRLQPTFDESAFRFMRNYNRGKTVLLYNTIQAYLKGSQANTDRHIRLAAHKCWSLGIKLVRGAYIEQETRSLIHDTREDSDESYARIVKKFINQELPTGVKNMHFPSTSLVLATYNADSVRNAIRVHQQRLGTGLPGCRR